MFLTTLSAPVSIAETPPSAEAEPATQLEPAADRATGAATDTDIGSDTGADTKADNKSAAEPDAQPDAAADSSVVLVDVAAKPAAVDTELTWEATENKPALFRFDAPSAGVLSLLARSDTGGDVRAVVADRVGIFRPYGDVDLDPFNLAGGEFGAVAIPEGPSTVVVGSNAGKQTGTLTLGFMPAEQIEAQPDRSAFYRAAVPLGNGKKIVGQTPVRDEANGAETRLCYVITHDAPSILRVRYAVSEGPGLEVYLYRSSAMWWPADYDAGRSGELAFYPNPGETWFVTVQSEYSDEGATFVLSIDDPNDPANRAASATPDTPTPSERSRSRRAPR